MKTTVFTFFFTISMIFAQNDYSGLWEGPKEDKRYDNVINSYGPIKLIKNSNGSYSSLYLGSYKGNSDSRLYKTTVDGNKITIIFRRSGHPLLKGEFIDGKFKGVLEHHFMVEKLEMTQILDRTNKEIISDFHNGKNILNPPSGSQLIRLMKEEGVDIALQIFNKIKKTHPRYNGLSQGDINTLGYSYIRENNTEMAIRILTLNTVKFPEDANVYDSLGEAYFENGDLKTAEKLLRKSLSLNPTKQTKTNSLRLLKKMNVSL